MSVLDAPETRRFLDETVRVWLGVKDAAVEIPSFPPELARLFLRLEEYERPQRDRWGCWDFEFSENFAAGRLREPEIDRWVADRRAELEGTTALEPLWPDARRFAVCLTHDVDLVSPRSTLRQVARYARGGLAPGVASKGEQIVRFTRPAVRIARSVRWGIARTPSTRETLERSVALEADRGAVASYLFTAPPDGGGTRYDCVYAPNDPCVFRGARMRVADLMRTIADEGFDVGLHGSYGAALRPGALTDERETLESATGLRLTTTRQHFLRWDVRTTPLLQEEAKLLVDSSLGFNRNVGFRAGTSLPFHHFDVSSAHRLGMLQVPLVVQDTALLAPGGLELDLAGARRLVQQLFDAVAAAGGAVTCLFHPDKLAQPEWLSLYEWCLDYAVEKGAWLTSLSRLGDWWLQREARLLGG